MMNLFANQPLSGINQLYDALIFQMMAQNWFQ